jgi:hypothetical protein
MHEVKNVHAKVVSNIRSAAVLGGVLRVNPAPSTGCFAKDGAGSSLPDMFYMHTSKNTRFGFPDKNAIMGL